MLLSLDHTNVEKIIMLIVVEKSSLTLDITLQILGSTIVLKRLTQICSRVKMHAFLAKPPIHAFTVELLAELSWQKDYNKMISPNEQIIYTTSLRSMNFKPCELIIQKSGLMIKRI